MIILILTLPKKLMVAALPPVWMAGKSQAGLCRGGSPKLLCRGKSCSLVNTQKKAPSFPSSRLFVTHFLPVSKPNSLPRLLENYFLLNKSSFEPATLVFPEVPREMPISPLSKLPARWDLPRRVLVGAPQSSRGFKQGLDVLLATQACLNHPFSSVLLVSRFMLESAPSNLLGGKNWQDELKRLKWVV